MTDLEKINFIKNNFIACCKADYINAPMQYHFYYKYDGQHTASLMLGLKEDYDLVKKSKCIPIIKNLEELNVL